MTTEHNYDLIVIGTGSGASSAASMCNKAGWKVAMVDSRPFGGTCALRGCDPKKVLVGAAEIIERAQRMKGKGISGEFSINWPDLMAFKRTFTEQMPESSEKRFKEQGIHTFHGKASFVSEDRIQVGENILHGRKFLIAAGAKPAPLPIDGAEHLTYSDGFMELDDLPKKLVFIGGGYISFEFAHIAARAGAEVHIIHRSERPLAGFDPELVDVLLQKSEEIAIRLHLNTDVKSVEKKGSGYLVKGIRNGQTEQWECGLVVHGAGRIPDLDGLDLDKGKVERDKKGVVVNEYLQSTSNPNVYAAGDAASTDGLPLTPVASMESQAAGKNLLNGNEEVPDYKVMPTVVFTIPKLASVGLSEHQAKELGRPVTINKMDTSEWYTYRRTNEKHTMAKVIIDKESGKILGAHLISDEADELINHFAAAIQFNLTVQDLKKMKTAYPTPVSDLGYML
ncbi:dihydrolipoyl dehydrogenase family protein [Paenibacillus lutrae]|uniref:NAD(P)/FAD-dependent oxidoreductase n=1 Tax=Paenibacillus lutrae TaxID=2078573 RepID=A0A7X3FK97_9BACL|nr:NAD(P)/FAD-dependent oxidoreductase [Paenibacillus lutrae]MVP01200.1 NAD(P)/FAD-dependent oxidoreductase [Paenibacillus lutrae]